MLAYITQYLAQFALTSQLLGSATSSYTSGSGHDVLQFVDPLIGTVNGGHVFPGATLPFGMAKAVADVDGENQGGFASDGSNITGFSHMHDSGTGGSPSMGNFPIFPQAGCPNNDITKCKFTINERATPRINGTVKASPGIFEITLASNVKAEMTVSNRTALYRFTFPSTPDAASSKLSPVLLADLIDLPDTRKNGAAEVDPKSGRMTGSGTFEPSFGIGAYKSYFCADFSGATVRDSGVFDNKGAQTLTNAITAGNETAGVWVRFNAPSKSNQILARVGVSFISTAQACSNAEREIPSFNFDDTYSTARKAWSEKLSTIKINPGSVSKDLQTVFWSGLYRSAISPQDYTGENPLWQSTEPYYDSYYCIWDSFRSIHPLITLFDPQSQALMIRSLIDVYRHEGKLPDCRMSLCKGFTQGGSNAEVVLVDSYVKGLTEGIDWNTAYEAMISDAEVEPPNWDVEGRGGLNSWKGLGYIPIYDTDNIGNGTRTRSVSRTVEYAYDDFCIAEMAYKVGLMADYEKYSNRSLNWYKLYKSDQKSDINGTDTGFTGYLQPRYANGTWAYQDPIFCSPLLNFTSCYLNPDGHETYEGSAWLYTFFAPHDMANLVNVLGGRDLFVERLDYMHDSGILYVGDEQGFLPVFQYHYAGRPAKSAERIHFYIPDQFNTTVEGIPGNDDSGAMGSFAVLGMLGIFPNPGQDVYLITPPFFEEVSIFNALTGKTATVRNVNFDASYKNIYIQSATLNGECWTKNWIEHSFFADGGVLELTLGDTESDWGTRDEDLPPSLPLREM